VGTHELRTHSGHTCCDLLFILPNISSNKGPAIPYSQRWQGYLAPSLCACCTNALALHALASALLTAHDAL
jgi:hypothetical protein